MSYQKFCEYFASFLKSPLVAAQLFCFKTYDISGTGSICEHDVFQIFQSCKENIPIQAFMDLLEGNRLYSDVVSDCLTFRRRRSETKGPSCSTTCLCRTYRRSLGASAERLTRAPQAKQTQPKTTSTWAFGATSVMPGGTTVYLCSARQLRKAQSGQ